MGWECHRYPISTSEVVYRSGPKQAARKKRLSFVCPSSSEPRGSEALTEFIQEKALGKVHVIQRP